MNAEAQPGLTVVVVALLGGNATARCTAALAGQDCVVAIVATGDEVTVPMARLMALRAATTTEVAFIEDTAIPAPGWCRAVRDGLRRAAAVGGPVVVSPALAPRFRALGLTEYGRFRVGTAPRGSLPGINFAVVRAAALGIVGDSPVGLVEGELETALAAEGRPVAWQAQMVVTYIETHRRGAALETRFQHGRLYASRRVDAGSAATRVVYAAAALVLPPLLTSRAVRSRPAALRASPATLGWIALLSAAWATGEFVGYVTGRAGRGLESWR